MPFEFRLPDIGEGVAEGEVVEWFVKEGATVQEDAPLVSVLTDKANVEIPSPKAGRVVKIHAQVGEKVKVGGLLVTIEPTGEGSTATGQPPPRAEAAHASPSAPSRPSGAAPSSTAAPSAPGGTSGERGPTRPKLASPSVRRLARERGIDLETIEGSGPGGRVVEADVLAARPASAPAGASGDSAATRAAATAPSAPRAGPSVTAAAAPTGTRVLETIPIRGIRRVIADHMAEATHRAAHFTYVEEVDATELVRLRDRMAKHIEKAGVRLSYLPFIVKAVVAGLKAHPRLNAHMIDERNELEVYASYHIGIATAAPDGLLVPVVRDADRKSVAQLAQEIQDLAERGRTGKLSRSELTGSTFTITSLGALGGVLATPILNYPEVGILGVHRITRRPVIRPDGTVGSAELMNLSISLDHRVIDGLEGAQFLSVVKGFLEDPHQLFAQLA